MITRNSFLQLAQIALQRNLAGNPNQRDALLAPPGDSILIVAGPGSGKTTVLALRVLKLILVDDIDPGTIVATTFTRRAAAELRSRILGWGDELRDNLLRANNPILGASAQARLQQLDFNRVVTGTIDSVAETVLKDYRPPGGGPPVVIEEFVADALMLRDGLFNGGRGTNVDLEAYIAQLNGTRFGLNIHKITEVLRDIADRVRHDAIDISRYASRRGIAPGIPIANAALIDYNARLRNDGVMDFAGLETEFLNGLQNGLLANFTSNIHAVLVDEYQDTNYLQESIYFEMARYAAQNHGGIAVVGDDDQSLYRFRGATVDLFQNFSQRLENALAITPAVIYLTDNYRSTNNIVSFCNQFVTLDTRYQAIRAQNKPLIRHCRTTSQVDYPILGMFRDGVDTLARDAVNFINRVCSQRGFSFTHRGRTRTIRINPNGGGPGDVALLCSSPREFDSQGNPRLPLLLRQYLGQANPVIEVYNPRGQELNLIPAVQTLCGLLLECIDPRSQTQSTLNLPNNAATILANWRAQAQAYIATNPRPNTRNTLRRFVSAWQNRRSQGQGGQRQRIWPDENVPLADLAYKLITWIPSMQDDIEGLVYAEVILRAITESARFSSFGGQIAFASQRLETASIRAAIWDIFLPLALGAIDINEDLLDTLPRDRINVMSIHQAKGLEFPLTIVDVGSDFRTEHHAHAFKRFPLDGGLPCKLEDELRPFSPLRIPQRTAVDRAFDDLVRQYLVAFSRAQDVLLLVGLNTVRNGYVSGGNHKEIPNVATGWDRLRVWHWARGLHNLVHI